MSGWVVLGAIVGAAMVVGGVLMLRRLPPKMQRGFAPEAQGLAMASGLAVAAIGPIILGLPWSWVGGAATLAAFPLAGAALRPGGVRLRGVALGLVAYVVVGVIVTALLYLSKGVQPFYFGPLFFLQVLIWPVMLSVGGPGTG